MASFTTINSVQNQRVKDAVKLRDRRGRDKQGRFLIDGLRELRHALEAGLRPQAAFVNRAFAVSDEATALLEQLADGGTALSEVSGPVWEKLTFGDRRDGILAVASKEVPSVETLDIFGEGPIVVLDRVEKPGNIGAVLRTADATGVSALALADPGTDLFNPNVIRASLGTVFRVPVYVDTASNLVAWLKSRQLAVWVARVEAEQDYFDANLRGTCAIVLGNEAEGVRPEWLADWMSGIRLPMGGTADSLNVSTAAAAILYEAVRQRRGVC